MSDGSAPETVGVVVLAYGSEPDLADCLTAISSSAGVVVDLVVVDNGCTNPGFEEIAAAAGARVLRPDHNRGFAGGCNDGFLALRPARAFVLVNSDAVVAPTAVARLVRALDDDVAIATASVRLAQEPETVNSAGNPVHFTGISWAGGFGEPADDHAVRREVASASGATMAMRTDVWQQLGGFDDAYFTYLEDTELSLRCWLAGLRVVYVPEAVSLHHYAFSRNAAKHYHLERNRLLLLLTVYERRTLLLLAPALLVWEACVLLGALRQGWGRSKLAGYAWLLRHHKHVRRRRSLVQAERLLPDGALVPLLADRLTMASVPLPRGFRALDRLLAAYWRGVRARIARSGHVVRDATDRAA
jgi:GT2 family glycosyltransferase